MNEIRREILSWTVDDSYGLWEILASVSVRLSEMTGEEVRRVVAREILEMMRDGLAELLHYSALETDERVLDLAEAEERMAAEQYWLSPMEHGPTLRIVATDQGCQAYYGLRTRQ